MFYNRHIKRIHYKSSDEKMRLLNQYIYYVYSSTLLSGLHLLCYNLYVVLLFIVL